MFDTQSPPNIVKSVVESADSGIESVNSTAYSAIIPLKFGLWVWAFIRYLIPNARRLEGHITILSMGHVYSFIS